MMSENKDLTSFHPANGPRLVRPSSVSQNSPSKENEWLLMNPDIFEAQPQSSGSNLTELRKATRYRLDSVAVLRCLDANEDLCEILAVVRDVSTCGVYVECEVSLSVNTNIELEIVPRNLDYESSRIRLYFEGKIVRVEKVLSKVGMAATGCTSPSGRRDHRLRMP
jgi:hypothetical protein